MWVYGDTVSFPRRDLPITAATLPEAAARGIAVPQYDRTAVAPRIVHLGVGGFHRSHMALYTDELAASGSTWGIRGLGLLPSDDRMARALAAQDCLYSLTERGIGSHTTQVIGSIVDYVHAADRPATAGAALAHRDVAILSLTITEAGYAEPVPGERNTFDALADALEVRRQDGGGPLTILSCDNLPGNGHVARNAMLRAARRHSSALAGWVEQQCSFPNSMVDRITPTTTAGDIDWLRDTYGVIDRWPVVGEVFRQWVIEDDFVAGRPDWDQVGALFTPDVEKWELYKLRMLNAGHSCIAYLSALAGIVYVDEAVGTPLIHAYLSQLLHDEALPTLDEIAGHPREDYIATVMERFANTGVRDQIARLCIDGSAKFPTFLLPTIAGQLRRDGSIDRATLALAAWARYLVTPLDQQAFDADGDTARRFAAEARDEPARFLDNGAVFPAELRDSPRFRATFEHWYRELAGSGPLAVIGSTLTPN